MHACGLGPEPPSRGRWRGSLGTGALYLTKPNQKLPKIKRYRVAGQKVFLFFYHGSIKEQ